MWTHCANRIWLKIRHLAIAQKEFELSSLVNDPLRKKNLHCVKRITIAHLEFPLRKKNFFQILKFYYTLRIFASLRKKNLSSSSRLLCLSKYEGQIQFGDCISTSKKNAIKILLLLLLQLQLKVHPIWHWKYFSDSGLVYDKHNLKVQKQHVGAAFRYFPQNYLFLITAF